MANQTLGLGSAANDGTGDTLRAALDKVNDNFLEIYTLIGDTSALTSGISATASVVTLTAPTITGVVGGTQTSATITTLATTTVNGTTLNGGTLALAAGSITDSSGAISFGNENLTTTGTITGALATAAQTAITSVGTLTALQVDNININGNAITSTAGTDLTISPVSGQQIVLDGTIVIDAGVVTGATSITSTAFVGNVTGNLAGTVSTATQNSITTATGLVSVGALNSGSITSGFTSIDVGAGAISTTGAVTYGSLNDGTTALGATAAELNILDASAGNTAVASDVASSAGAVTSNNFKISHTLTLAAELADDAEHADVVITSDKCLATSTVIANASIDAHVDIHTVVAGSFKVRITNKSGGALANDSTMVLNYKII